MSSKFWLIGMGVNTLLKTIPVALFERGAY